jgi:hypothetical protein
MKYIANVFRGVSVSNVRHRRWSRVWYQIRIKIRDSVWFRRKVHVANAIITANQ